MSRQHFGLTTQFPSLDNGRPPCEGSFTCHKWNQVNWAIPILIHTWGLTNFSRGILIQNCRSFQGHWFKKIKFPGAIGIFFRFFQRVWTFFEPKYQSKKSSSIPPPCMVIKWNSPLQWVGIELWSQIIS